nr:MAG TPA: intron associated endonuclease [Caudoviricetes sp.]
MKETNFKLYIHVNKINNKKYVGITKQHIKERCRSDGSGYSRNPYFYNAIKKYGWDNFEHIIIYRNLTYEMAIKLEQTYILLMHTRDKHNGYNMTDGGDGALGCHPSLESIEKRRLKRIGKKATESQLKGLTIGREYKKKKVYCVDDFGNKIKFNSIKEASEYFNNPRIWRKFSIIVREHIKENDRYWYYMEV